MKKEPGKRRASYLGTKYFILNTLRVTNYFSILCENKYGGRVPLVGLPDGLRRLRGQRLIGS